MRDLLLLLEGARRGSGSFAVVEGEPGVGRTELLRAVAGRATHADVYAARGGEYERELPLGVARQLFAPLPDAERWLEDGAAALQDGLGGRWRWQASMPHALRALTHRLSTAGPAVLIVDDVQWADEASIQFLAYLGRRVAQERMLVLVGLRSADRDGVPALRPLLPPAVDALRIALAPLGPASVERLVARTLGERPAGAFASACHAATAGNPALVRWLLAALRRRGVAPREEAIEQIEQCAPPELHDWLRGRMAELPSGAQSFAEALTVLEGRGVARRRGRARRARLRPGDARRRRPGGRRHPRLCVEGLRAADDPRRDRTGHPRGSPRPAAPSCGADLA